MSSPSARWSAGAGPFGTGGLGLEKKSATSFRLRRDSRQDQSLPTSRWKPKGRGREDGDRGGLTGSSAPVACTDRLIFNWGARAIPAGCIYYSYRRIRAPPQAMFSAKDIQVSGMSLPITWGDFKALKVALRLRRRHHPSRLWRQARLISG
jgi:hypothetical protein